LVWLYLIGETRGLLFPSLDGLVFCEAWGFVGSADYQAADDQVFYGYDFAFIGS